MTRLSLIAIVIACAAGPAAAQDRRGFVWKDRPTIVFGEDVTVEVKGRALVEWRRFDPEIGEDTFHLRTARVGLAGDLTRHLDWEIEREIAEVDDKVQFTEWKDVYVRWRTFDAVRVIGGRFKMPFGLEQTTGVSDLDFAYRSLGSNAIAPGRDRGVMVFGEAGRFNYEAGVFDDDGNNAESNEPQFVQAGEDLEDVGPSVAARIGGDLLRLLPVGRLRSANLGVAYTNSRVPEGLNSLRGESVWGADFFERVYVKGRRQRLGAQFEWTPGPASVKAEWMQSREQRQEQSNRNADLSDYIGEAWYVAGTWFVTGEDKDSNVNPRRPLLEGGIGAIELAIRYERLGFRSASTTGTAFRNPRSDYLLPNSNRVWTFGANWITSKWTRVIVNAIHENIEDVDRAPVTGAASYWSTLARLNIVF
ncbi:MAG TPA: porin [Vicinamibacterales bacterium]|nr:porin [Vicinamibacterales bacterium]